MEKRRTAGAPLLQQARALAACRYIFRRAPIIRMLRYDRPDRHPPNYLSRSGQWRVLRLVIALGLVLLLINAVGSPRAAQVLGIFFGGEQQVGTSRPTKNLAPRTGPGGQASADLSRRRTLAASSVEGLDEVRDNAPFRNEEVEPWYELLGVLHGTTAQDLAAGSVGEITAVQLLEQPQAYRGRLVTVHGMARQSTKPDPFGAAPSSASLARLVFFPELELPSLAIRAALTQRFLTGYRRIVVQQPGASVPIVVFTLDVPERFPVGPALREQVTATGYFFKNWLFASDEGLGVGPVVLAKQIHWHPDTPPAPRQAPMDASEVAWTVASAVLVAAVSTWWLVRRSRTGTHRPRQRDIPQVVSFPGGER